VLAIEKVAITELAGKMRVFAAIGQFVQGMIIASYTGACV
jgi:hypothetical protein